MLRFHTVIIGSGAAGYAAAQRLLSLGVTDIAVVTSGRTDGTSRNAGSDKQTYYKLSQTQEDSPRKMALALCCGGAMHGDAALVEAANSLRCFMRLAEYGVPFPTDEHGRFVGYQTDHDTVQRGTSAGPLTSKYITESLERAVLKSGHVQLIDETTAVKIVTDGGRAVGLIGLQRRGEGYAFVPLAAKYIIAATGGAATIYSHSVYPQSQRGALGLLAQSGCSLNNITEWQYGIASLDARWNLSGSYQQVVPAYYSVDENANVCEFLPKAFGCASAAYNAVFLKGYQWPFDSEKINGSSKIDLAVSEECAKGRQVYIDFRRNPQGYSFSLLSREAKNYLESAGASGDTPLERLKKLNPQAVGLFKSKKIDLSASPLRVAVCAQHINGGAQVDLNRQTDIENLFAIGEAAGTFGIYRPGGAALNSTQVGALRAAEYISRAGRADFCDDDIIEEALKEERRYIEQCLQSAVEHTDFSQDMSRCAGHCRQLEETAALCLRLQKQCGLKYYRLSENTYQAVRGLYEYRDTILAQRLLCEALVQTLPQTGSRGGAICLQNGELLKENKYYRDFVVQTDLSGSRFIPVRPMPDTDYSFEAVWNRFNEERGISLE